MLGPVQKLALAEPRCPMRQVFTLPPFKLLGFRVERLGLRLH